MVTLATQGASTQIVSSTFTFLPRMVLPPTTPPQLTLHPPPSPSARGVVSVFSHGEGETLWCPDSVAFRPWSLLCFSHKCLQVCGVRTPLLHRARAPMGATGLYPPSSGQLLLVVPLSAVRTGVGTAAERHRSLTIACAGSCPWLDC